MMAGKSFVFRFDDVEVREREFTLIKAGKVLTIEPKAFRTLLFLLHNPERLIPKEELLDAVWDDAAVTEGSLTRCISLLRSRLGDDIRQPRYIATVATVGYRFVCKVEVSEEAFGSQEAAAEPKDFYGNGQVEAHASNAVVGAVTDAPQEMVSDRAGSRWRMRRWLLPGAAVLVFSVAAAIWNLHRPLPTLKVTGYTQITHDGHQKILVGTDGNRLYFNDSFGSIAQVATSGGEIAQVPGMLPDPFLVDVSPDGASFLTATEKGLWNVRVLGGSVRHLPDADSAAFSPDGNSVAYVTESGDIYLVRSDGTQAHKLASAGDLVRDIAWSPDGAVIRFTMKDRIWEILSNGSNLQQLIPEWHPSSAKCCGRWAADGRFFLFLSEGQIWALPERRGLFGRPSAEPVQLTQGPIRWGGLPPGSPHPAQFSGGPIPARDGSKIFAEGVTPRGELSRFDSKSKQFQPFLGGISAQGVIFSKDGKSIAYVSYPDGILWKANRDGSNPVQLTDPPIEACLPRWSPDGTQIVFTDISSFSSLNRVTSYIVSSEGGSPRKLLPEDHDSNLAGNWSPDGHKIVFASVPGDLKSIVCILDLDSRQITAVPGSEGLTGARWSPDGRYLVVDTLKIFDFKRQQWSDLGQRFVESPEWSMDGQFIYFKRISGDRGVFRIRLKGGAAEKIADLRDWHDAGWWGSYMGLDPTDAPLLLRDIGSSDIYALTLQQK
jgi:DNA-binding winged helix-turn-helix (wHTH) protein/Tol biopolymer transport system component